MNLGETIDPRSNRVALNELMVRGTFSELMDLMAKATFLATFFKGFLGSFF